MTTYLRRSIDHLGALSTTLRDLGGATSLGFELMQNADDADDATEIAFSFTENALVVANDGVFSDCGSPEDELCTWKSADTRSCDFHGFRRFAAAEKRNDAGTTGAFGIGFTAVYQVTDHPEILSVGRHWILDESAPEDQRIAVCEGGCGRDHAAPGTTIVLPWAKADTEIRHALQVEPLTAEVVDNLAHEMRQHAPTALLFVRRLRSLTIIDLTGTATFSRKDVGGNVVLDGPRGSFRYRLLTTELDHDDFRRRHSSAAAQRSSSVSVAVPYGEGAPPGLLFAGLPTTVRTELPFSVNADFYPRSDRKGILLEDDYRSEWNRLAIDAAANLVADELETLSDVLGDEALWSMLVLAERLNSRTSEGAFDRSFSSYWRSLAPVVRTSVIAPTLEGGRRPPDGLMVPSSRDGYPVGSIAARLGTPVVAQHVHPYVTQLGYSTTFGMRELTPARVIEALLAFGLTTEWVRGSSTAPLDTAEYELLVRFLSDAIPASGTAAWMRDLDRVALAACDDDVVRPFRNCHHVFAKDRRALRPLLSDVHALAELFVTSAPRLADNVAALDVDAVVDLLAAGALSRLSISDATAIIRWLAGRTSDVLADGGLCQELRGLALFPAGGRLVPLADAALPGFEDPLGIASVLDMTRLRGLGDFLTDLGARRLTVLSYFEDHLLPLLCSGDLDESAFDAIRELIVAHLSEIADADDIRSELAEWPLLIDTVGVRCCPSDAYFAGCGAREVLADLPEVSAAAASERQAYTWLGVQSHLRASHILETAQRVAAGDLQPAVAERLFQSLADHPQATDWLDDGDLAPLKGLAWLPSDQGRLHRASAIYPTFQRHLFESQGAKLAFPLSLQRESTRLRDALGMPTEPTVGLVLDHLLHCAAAGAPVNTQVYTYLQQKLSEAPELIGGLQGKPCLYIEGAYYRPDRVFWEGSRLGNRTVLLDESWRQLTGLLNELGVLKRPNYDAAHGLLREIAVERRYDTLIGDDEDLAAVEGCWSVVAEAMALDEVYAERVSSDLADLPSIADGRGVLTAPSLMVFADAAGVAARFLLLANNLVSRRSNVWRAHLAAGVADIADLVSVELAEEVRAVEDSELELHVLERSWQLARALDATEDADGVLEQLRSLTFERAPSLMIMETLSFVGHQQQLDPRIVGAVFLPQQHRLVRDETAAASAPVLARELVHAIGAPDDLGQRAGLVAAVLGAATVEAAEDALTQLGVPSLERQLELHEAEIGTAFEIEPDLDVALLADVEATRLGLPDSETESGDAEIGISIVVTPPDDADDCEAPVAGEPQCTPTEAAPSAIGAARAEVAGSSTRGAEDVGRGDLATATRARRRAPARPTHNPTIQPQRRMLSYVVRGSAGEKALRGQEAGPGSDIDVAGVSRVLDHERAAGRRPMQQEHNNPGFDVDCFSEDGELVRRIEVKSTAGPWKERGVAMSRRQYAENEREADLFWLYVVEFATDEARFRIHRLQNPAADIGAYLFDEGWRALAEPDGTTIPVQRESFGSGQHALAPEAATHQAKELT